MANDLATDTIANPSHIRVQTGLAVAPSGLETGGRNRTRQEARPTPGRTGYRSVEMYGSDPVQDMPCRAVSSGAFSGVRRPRAYRPSSRIRSFVPARCLQASGQRGSLVCDNSANTPPGIFRDPEALGRPSAALGTAKDNH